MNINIISIDRWIRYRSGRGHRWSERNHFKRRRKISRK